MRPARFLHKGQEWEVVREKLGDYWGYVDKKKRQIVVDESLSGVEFLAVLMHESVHLAKPDLSERTVRNLESVFRNVLESAYHMR